MIERVAFGVVLIILEIFFIPGVDRNGMKSLFTPNTRWRVVTEEGFEGGPVIPGDYDPDSPKSIGEIQLNMVRAGILGDLVANDLKSMTIIVPLLDINPETGERLDYADLSSKLEEIRERFTAGNPDRTNCHTAATQLGLKRWIPSSSPWMHGQPGQRVCQVEG